jgi:hypothetical protein
MKNNYKRLAFVAIATTFASVLTAQVNTSCGNNNSKVLICHIPPGNPANAHTICVSANAVNAHLYGNNTHNDFLGDCYSGCLGMRVESKSQGLRNNGTPVPLDRSDETKVLGVPDKINSPGGFYSLGFGGEIVVEMDGGIINRPGDDLQIFETSFGQPACANYRERAKIEVSPDLVSWQEVGTICQDGSVDIGTFDYIRFVKITDVSDPADFGNAIVDGFDVDGIQCIPIASSARIGQSEIHEEHDLTLGIFPNPTNDMVNLNFDGIVEGQEINIELMDNTGRMIRSQKFVAAGEAQMVQFSTTELSAGIYMIQIKGEGLNQVHKLVKN